MTKERRARRLPKHQLFPLMRQPYSQAMQTHIVFLRAVNVGGTGKLPMATLRSMVEAEGFDDVRTYIQSGNLILRSSQSAETIKSALERRLERYAGEPVDIIMRTLSDLREVLRSNPFPDAAPNKVGVLILNNAPDIAVITDAKGHSDEDIRPGKREIFIHFPSGMGSSKLRLAGMSTGTMRNINTVNKIVQLAT